jgi:hypothetical protein
MHIFYSLGLATRERISHKSNKKTGITEKKLEKIGRIS